MNSSKYYSIFLIAAASLLLFIPFMGKVHLFDWDEINFAECAREMIVTGDYSTVRINFQPFWEKPPLFIWLQVISMKIFGVNEFAARFPNALCGFITLALLFYTGRRLYDNYFGFLWVISYAGSLLPHFYFRSGIIDPWFNLFIFCAIYFFILFTNDNQINSRTNNTRLVLAGLFTGLGIMTKGPVALLIFCLCGGVYWLLKRMQPFITFRQAIYFALATLGAGGLWFLTETLRGRFYILTEFFQYQVRLLTTADAGHGGPFFYHFVVLLLGCFPASVFMLYSFKKQRSDTPFQRHFKTWMILLLAVVLLLFSLVKTKIVHYSSLCYFPLTYLAAYTLYKLRFGEITWKKGMTRLLWLIGGALGVCLALLPLVDALKEKIIASGLIKDPFAAANLTASVHWTGWESLIGTGLLVTLLLTGIAIRKQNIKRGILLLFTGSLLTISLALIIIVPKIEYYSQGAAIEFYESLQDKDCYVETLGFKSYAYLFYSHKRKPENEQSLDKSWLLNGPVDKPAFFVGKIQDKEKFKRDYPQLKQLYEKNGFVFYER